MSQDFLLSQNVRKKYDYKPNPNLWLFLSLAAIIVILNFASSVTVFYYESYMKKVNDQCAVISDESKFDCYPEAGVDESKCKLRGCCWQQKSKTRSPLNVPWCYYPSKYGGYDLINKTNSCSGAEAFLLRNRPSVYPNDVKLLKMIVEHQTASRVHVKIFDPIEKRFESPYPEQKRYEPTNATSLNYNVEVSKENLGFKVSRASGDILFDAQDKGGFIFADQFLQISSQFYGKIYGIGEHQSHFRLDTNWSRFTLFNHDSIPLDNRNLYGSHPFYLVLEPKGTCHGVFLRNSNAMDVLLQPLPAITFRAIGGVLDFYFFTGPSPAEVVSQYLELIGRPVMPPYWSLGFHLCRLGYRNIAHVGSVLNRTLQARIPVETQWIDLDYMDRNNDFTVNNVTFRDLTNFIDELHSKSMRFIPLIDPGISAGEPNGTYEPFDLGIQSDVFIKNEDGSLFVGKVWNKKSTAFPDFSNRKTFVYWGGLIREFHSQVPFDGLWIDMNEPSNFIDGSFNGCPNNNLEHPPYLPGVDGGKLAYKTVCMSAKMFAGSHYDLHNLYGISEAHATHRALRETLQKRPFIISRSTFPGIGAYAGHWSGDVESSWRDMKLTIPQLLSFSLYGVPMMGADICGFNGNTTKYLCLRWSQLGAFYPFSRNHNTDDGIAQDPVALGEEVADAARTALEIRYTMLPYLYTLFWKAHSLGETVARPLFFEFPMDKNTHDLDESFLWGCCVLIAPVLEEFKTTVETYLPAGLWYDWYSLTGRQSTGSKVTLSAPTSVIPILIRGGVVLPLQKPALTTAKSRSNNMTLIAAYDGDMTALGSLYWDDGESIYIRQSKSYGDVGFELNANNFTSKINHWGMPESPIVDTIRILGFVKPFKIIIADGKIHPYNYNSTTLVLTLEGLNILIKDPFIVTWC